MVKITLAEKFQTEKVLQSGLIVSSKLIGKLEVYGFLNSCKGVEIIVESSYGKPGGFNNFVNSMNFGDVLCAGYMAQPCRVIDEKGTTIAGMRLHQVFASLEVTDKELLLDLADLDIPSLFYNPAYLILKKRNSAVRLGYNAKYTHYFPKNIKRSEKGAFEHTTEVGDILCRDKDGVVKGIGDHLVAICRYLSPQTGMMCYAYMEFDELYVEEEQ